MAKKLSSKSYQVALAIKDREPFTTHGALSAVAGNPGTRGQLNQTETDAYYRDVSAMDFCVLSYATPIAWHTPERGWHKVDQKFSRTTSVHQGKLYMIPTPTSF